MRNGYVTTQKQPTRIAYRASDLADVDEVMRIFRAAGVTEFDWIPIRVVENE